MSSKVLSQLKTLFKAERRKKLCLATSRANGQTVQKPSWRDSRALKKDEANTAHLLPLRRLND